MIYSKKMDLPSLTFTCPIGTDHASLQLCHTPARRSRLSSELQISSEGDFKSASDQAGGEAGSVSPLKIPSPTYRISFTPEFLITSFPSDDDYSDGTSDFSAGTDPISSNHALPWSSEAEYVKPWVNQLVDAERKLHDSVRLKWRATLPATPNSSHESASTMSQTPTESIKSPPSSWISCPSHPEHSIFDSSLKGLSLRRTKSMVDLHSTPVSKSPQKLANIPFTWSSPSIYQGKEKAHAIWAWASAISD